MILRQACIISRAPMAGLAVVGLFWGGLSALIPDLKHMVQASDAEFGMVLVLSAVGGMFSMYFAPQLGRWIGGIILPISVILLAVIVTMPLFIRGIQDLAVVFCCLGAAVAMLDISANMRLAELEAEHKMHVMNISHAVFSFAFGGAAFLTGLARKFGLGPSEILPILALCIAGGAWFTWEQSRVPVVKLAPSEPVARIPWRAVGLTALILFASFIGENATEAWSALHIERTLGGAPGEGGFGPAMLGFSMGFGRLAGQYFAQRLGEVRLVFWSAVLGAIGAAIIGLAPTQFVALTGIAILGLGMAVVVPTANSVLGKRVALDQIGLAISRAWMFGFIGFFIGPSMMGLLSEFFGLRLSFVAMSGIIALIIPSVKMLGMIEKRQE